MAKEKTPKNSGAEPTRRRAGYYDWGSGENARGRGDDRALVRGPGDAYGDERPNSVSPLVSANDRALGEVGCVPQYDPERKPTGHKIFRRQ